MQIVPKPKCWFNPISFVPISLNRRVFLTCSPTEKKLAESLNKTRTHLTPAVGDSGYAAENTRRVFTRIMI